MKLSASQISKGKRCLKLYSYEYVEGFKPPSSPKQMFGIAVHKQLEKWLRKGIVPDNSPAGLVAKQGIQKNWLPVPSDDLLIEQRFEIPWHRDVVMVGFVDCTIVENVPIIIDHKTTSSLTWAKTEEQLLLDEQAIIYALWAMFKLEAKQVKARWVYYAASNPNQGPRKPAGAKAVQVLFDIEQQIFIDKIKDLLSLSKKLIWIKKNKIKAKELTPNPYACGAFGGCPHKERCNLSGEDKIKGYFEKGRF